MSSRRFALLISSCCATAALAASATAPIVSPETPRGSSALAGDPLETANRSGARSSALAQLSRPLFSPKAELNGNAGRHDTGRGPHDLFRLVGVVDQPGRRTALVETGSPKRVTRVVEGDALGEWRVTGIRPKSLELGREGAVEIISLDARGETGQ